GLSRALEDALVERAAEHLRKESEDVVAVPHFSHFCSRLVTYPLPRRTSICRLIACSSAPSSVRVATTYGALVRRVGCTPRPATCRDRTMPGAASTTVPRSIPFPRLSRIWS